MRLHKPKLLIQLITFLSAYFAYSFATAQEAEEQFSDFREIATILKDKYLDVKGLHVVMEIEVFKSKSATKPFHFEYVDVKKSEAQFLTSYKDFEMLFNDRFFIVVNKQTREIAATPIKERPEFEQPDPLSMLDSLANYDLLPQLISRKGNTQHYQVRFNQGAIRELNIYIDIARLVYEKIEYLYADNNLARISFVRFDIDPSFDSNVFDESNYLVRDGRSFKASKKYENFLVFVQKS